MNTPSALTPKYAHPLYAAFVLIIDRERYIDLAAPHSLARNLEEADYREKFAAGTWPKAEWVPEQRQAAARNAEQLIAGLCSSFVWTLGCVFLGLLIAFLFGRMSPEMPFAWAKATGILGGFLAAWATLLELGGFSPTYGGKALHEIVRPVIFKALFLPGVSIAAVGQLW